MPPGSLVPRDWLLEQLSGVSPTPSESHSTPAALVDLTIGDLARLFGKQPSTVRAWVERGDFPGAYKLHGKEWRVPPSALDAFQQTQRAWSAKPHAGVKVDLSAWRAVRRSPDGPHQGGER